MILKRDQTSRTTLSHLDLLGSDEIALSKAFAFLLSTDNDCYFKFLKFLGISSKNTSSNYSGAEVSIEKKRDEGRTDIELFSKNKYHVIIESKIGNGKVVVQRKQYLTAFEKATPKKVLCILTQQRDTNKQIEKDVTIINTSWLEIIELYNTKHFINKKIVIDFLKFATKNYRMRELKEILIQDLSDRIEIERFNQYGVYRRQQIFGTPIYFAPYFNRGSGELEGITKLSRILGIITFKPNDIDNFRSDLESFSNDIKKIDDWITGIKLGNDSKEVTFTYYFLDTPLIFTKALRKDPGKQKGRGKNWIAAMIPPNRCVSFIDFIRHIPELMKSDND